MGIEMSDSGKAERLATLHAEIRVRLAEVCGLIAPERVHMLYPAAKAIERECSLGIAYPVKGAEQ
jgi:hypothetical protein